MQAAGRRGPVGMLWGGSGGDRTEDLGTKEPELCLGPVEIRNQDA